MGDENTLISPLSAIVALSMTANGAGGETLLEMEQVLAGGMDISMQNENLAWLLQSLSGNNRVKLSLANSIWSREGRIKVNKEFLQKNADYYRAGAFAAPFDAGSINDINSWVSKNTNGTIKKMIKDITGNTMMILINALGLDARWQEQYTEN